MQDLVAGLSQRRDGLFSALNTESDRGIALLYAAFLDDALEHLLRSRFKVRASKPAKTIDPLFDALGPLGSFSAKSRLAYAMDLIPEWVYTNLELLRRIRNEAAHSSYEFTFDSPKIRGIISTLTSPPLNRQYDESRKDLGARNEQRIDKLTDMPEMGNIHGGRRKFGHVMTYIAGIFSAAIVVLESDLPEEFRCEFLFKFDQPS